MIKKIPYNPEKRRERYLKDKQKAQEYYQNNKEQKKEYQNKYYEETKYSYLRKMELNKYAAPDEYWALTPEQKEELTNGCGPKAIEAIIPDKILGLSIEEA